MKQLPQVVFIHAEDVVKGHEVILGHLEWMKEAEVKQRNLSFGIFAEGLQTGLLKVAYSNFLPQYNISCLFTADQH